VVQKRLDNIKPRLQRAGVTAELHQLGPNGGGVEDMIQQADVVLVDAPCTGSGTWRRRPEDAWRLKPEEVDRMHTPADGHRRPGGQAGEARRASGLCHLFDAARRERGDPGRLRGGSPVLRPRGHRGRPEHRQLHGSAGRDKLAELAAGGHRLRLSPATAGTDGFFAAVYERQA
jgi:16S rRNA (cytosine967-C5)-methyltransferase